MATVNHKRIREEIEKKISNVSSKEFFTNRKYGYAKYLEDIAAAQTKRYHYDRRPKVNMCWESDSEIVAYTDNETITINAACDLIKNVKKRKDKHWNILGLFVHELGHMLYTDFLASQTWINFLQNDRWYPKEPEIVTITDMQSFEDIKEYIKLGKKHFSYVAELALFIWNILEDGYIEGRISERFPGMFGEAVKSLRRAMISMSDSLGDVKDSSGDGSCLLQGILTYATSGTINYGSLLLTDPVSYLLHDLLDDIDRAVTSYQASDRAEVVNRILVHGWPLLKIKIENDDEESEGSENSASQKKGNDPLKKITEGIKGTSKVGAGNAPVKENDLKQEKERKEEAKSKKREGTSHNATENKSDSNKNGDVKEDMNFDQQDISQDEKGRLSNGYGKAEEGHGSGRITYDESFYESCYEKASSDIERVLEKEVKSEVNADLEKERLSDLQSFASSIDYGNIHKNSDITIRRCPRVDEEKKQQYEKVAPSLHKISMKLCKGLERHLLESRKSAKLSGLPFGRKMDSHSLYRRDGKVFYKNSIPNDRELAVAFLADESGSMASKDRASYARATAIIIYDFCKRLKIPVMIYGHHTEMKSHHEEVILDSYAEFDQIDQDDNVRLMGITARGANRDGCAVRFICESLLKRPEADKLFFILSDGQPSAWDYSGEAAESDLKSIKREYVRKGIVFVAAAIGDDKENIERIYGNSFIDVSNLEKLPEILTNFIKRQLSI